MLPSLAPHTGAKPRAYNKPLAHTYMLKRGRAHTGVPNIPAETTRRGDNDEG